MVVVGVLVGVLGCCVGFFWFCWVGACVRVHGKEERRREERVEEGSAGAWRQRGSCSAAASGRCRRCSDGGGRGRSQTTDGPTGTVAREQHRRAEMEANAGLIAGSHNRNELVVIRDVNDGVMASASTSFHHR